MYYINLNFLKIVPVYNFYFYKLLKYIPYQIICQAVFISNDKWNEFNIWLQTFRFCMHRVQYHFYTKMIYNITRESFYLVYPLIYSNYISGIQHHNYKYNLQINLDSNILISTIESMDIVSYKPMLIIYKTQLFQSSQFCTTNNIEITNMVIKFWLELYEIIKIFFIELYTILNNVCLNMYTNVLLIHLSLLFNILST